MKIWRIQITALLILTWAISGCGFNRLQQLEESVFAAWDELEADLAQQADLALDLLSAVKDSVSSESRIPAELATARAAVVAYPISVEELASPEPMAHLQQLQEALSAALADLQVLARNDQRLRSNSDVSGLLLRIEAGTQKIRASRQRYNQEAEQFNAAIREFPSSLTNRMLLGLERKEYYTAKVAADFAVPAQPATAKEN